MIKRKWPKIDQRGFPFGNPFDGKGLCGPYPQWRQAAVTVHPTSHVPPANAAKQVGRKYEWRHLPLRGSRGQHFTVFQSQPPGRQPFGLKVKSPRLPSAGRSPSRRGAPSYPGGQGQPRFRREQRAGWADAPLPGPAAQGAPILPGGQWRPGFGRESSGRPGRHPPLDGCRPARGPGGLPGRSLSLSLGRESEARTSGATGVLLE